MVDPLLAALLPPEVLALIFHKLPLKRDRVALLQVCKAWRLGLAGALPSLTLPWPISGPSAPTPCKGSRPSSSSSSFPSPAWALGVPAKGEDVKCHAEGVPSGDSIRGSAGRTSPPTKCSSSLSVRWLGATARLFQQLTFLELTVPVPPEALLSLALLPLLRRLSFILRPPPFSTAAANGPTVHVASSGPFSAPQAARDEKYEAAFITFLSSCTALEDLTVSMRACRWEHWPLLSASLLSKLAESLRSLVSLHIKSPLFSSHAIGPLLSLPHLSALTLPLDLPYLQAQQLSSAPLSAVPPLQALHLQPYNQLYGAASWAQRGLGRGAQRGPGLQSVGTPGGGAGDTLASNDLPAVLSSLTTLQSLRVGGYGRSALYRTEFMSNPLTSVPDLSPLLQLRTLELCSLKELEELPTTLCSLPALAELTLQDCPMLLQLPEELGSLGGSLRKVHLHFVGLHQLPQSFVLLTSLTDLCLSHLYWLEALPPELGRLSCLQSLRVISCKRIPELAPSLPAITALRTLVLTFNAFALPPPLFTPFPLLSSLTLSLSSPRDLELGPALAAMPSLAHLHLTMSDDGAGMSISGADITRMVPPWPQLLSLKIEDLRSSGYSAFSFRVDNGDAGVGAAQAGLAGHAPPQIGAPQEDGVEPALGLEYSLAHFTHGPYPCFAALKQLQVKCAWLLFDHESFPELEVVDIVLLCRSRPDALTQPREGRKVQFLRDLLAELFLCQKLRTLALFTPEAPDALSAPRGAARHGALSRALFPGSKLALRSQTSLQSFTINDIDVLSLL